MPDVNHPTRALLLDAGRALAEARPLSSLSVDDIVGSAKLAKGTFYVHFSDRAAYLAALHDQFHDDLRARIRTATKSLGPGVDRLRVSTLAYLDGCLDASGVKAMLAEARAEPAIAEKVAAADERFARSATTDMTEIGKQYPYEAARLFVAMTATVAVLELPRRRADTKLRAALLDYIRQ
jgi:TetR/AcrR family transcriptional repressor of nem operon